MPATSRCRTLWDAVHAAGGKVASIGWPVSVDAPVDRFQLPRILASAYLRRPEAGARAGDARGWLLATEAKTGVNMSAMFGETPQADDAKAAFAAAIYDLDKPTLMTLHLSSLDHIQHDAGPGSSEAKATLCCYRRCDWAFWWRRPALTNPAWLS